MVGVVGGVVCVGGVEVIGEEGEEFVVEVVMVILIINCG